MKFCFAKDIASWGLFLFGSNNQQGQNGAKQKLLIRMMGILAGLEMAEMIFKAI